MAEQPSVSNKYTLGLVEFKPQTSQLADDKAYVSIFTRCILHLQGGLWFNKSKLKRITALGE